MKRRDLSKPLMRIEVKALTAAVTWMDIVIKTMLDDDPHKARELEKLARARQAMAKVRDLRKQGA
jgi:hypothetical protein